MLHGTGSRMMAHRMARQLQIEVLGGLAVKYEGEPLRLPRSRKTRALLGYLSVSSRPQPREHLCGLFWDLADDPRASLRWSLHKIRRVTNVDGLERLQADRNLVRLAPDTVNVDFLDVTELCRAGSLDTLDRASLERASSRFRGAFLDGLALPRCPQFEAWRQYCQEQARQWHIEILRKLVSYYDHTPHRARFYARLIKSLDEMPRGEQRSDRVPEIVSSPAVRSRPDHASPDQTEQSPPDSPTPSGGRQLSMTAHISHAARPQQIRFCRTGDGAQLAFAVCGQGPPIVRAAHWMSHLQYEWESPVWRHWIDALSRESTLVRYDERGNGLSDWNVPEISFPTMVSDLECVVDAAGLDRFTLLGVSQSCAVAVAYAVRNPDRLTRLILYGGFVKGWRRRGDFHEIAKHEAMTTLIREGWGQNDPVFRHMFTQMFIPGAHREQMDWFDELQRIAVPPENAARLYEVFGEIDVSDLLPRLTVPTLVLHARHDAAVPHDSGRDFATGIPNARFVDLDSANHILLAEESAFEHFLNEVKRFVAETR